MAKAPKLKLFQLKPIEGAKAPNNISPWREPWQCVNAMIVQAEDEDAARKIAQENGGDECNNTSIKPWLLEKYTSCTELKAGTEPGVIIKQQRVRNF